MKQMWQTDIKTICEYYEMLEQISKDFGRELTTDESEFIFLEFAKIKNIKSLGNTELNKTELIKDALEKNGSLLNIDENGFTFIKKKEN